MKNITKHKPKKRVIRELAEQFDIELNKQLPITLLPNGDTVYKNYIVKQLPSGNWGLYNFKTKELVDQFFLKSCALMAAKAYNYVQMRRFKEIKTLDSRYWANYCDSQVYKHNIKITKDNDRYLILLDRLAHSQSQVGQYKAEISRMFKSSFV